MKGIVHGGKFVFELEQNQLGYFRIIVTRIFLEEHVIALGDSYLIPRHRH
jgi:hypothetical protein